MKSKIEIELTEKEASHLRTLLEGGIKISDSISQGEVFKNILDHLNSQDQVCEGKDLDELMPISYEEIQGTDLYGKSRADVLGELEETLEILKDTKEEWEKEREAKKELLEQPVIVVKKRNA